QRTACQILGSRVSVVTTPNTKPRGAKAEKLQRPETDKNYVDSGVGNVRSAVMEASGAAPISASAGGSRGRRTLNSFWRGPTWLRYTRSNPAARYACTASTMGS